MKKILFIGLYLFINTLLFGQSPNTWIDKASIGGTAKTGYASFVIGAKIYVATGAITSSGVAVGTKELWEYDPITDAWTRKADFPGTARYYAFGFSIGSKGYIGTGRDGNTSIASDFWEYNPATNTWSQKADFPGGQRMSAFGITINNRGYAGGGVSNGTGGSVFGSYNNDLYEYIPTSNTWVQKASFGSSGRMYITSFVINTKGYVGLGALESGSSCSNCARTNDFYEYSSDLNTWKKIANYPDSTGDAFGFSIGTSGFVGGGSTKSGSTRNFYEYIPSLNKWRIRASTIYERSQAIGANNTSNGYMMGGYNIANGVINNNNDVKQYSPCNGYIYSSVLKYICEGQSFDFNGRSLTTEGTYYDTLYSKNGCDSAITLNLKVVKNPIVTISSEKTPTICNGDSLRVYSNERKVDTLSYQWLLNNTSITQKTDTSYYMKTAGAYALKVTNNTFGCVSTSTSVTLVVNALPAAPTVQNKDLCKDSTTVSLSVTPLANHKLKWYWPNTNGPNTDTLAPTPSSKTVGSSNYYVTQTNSLTGCQSPQSKITVTIYDIPVPPVVSDLTYCLNSTAIALKSNALTGNVLQWYGTSSSGGIASSSAPVPLTTTVGSQNYYVSQKFTAAGCESNRSAIKVTILDLPPKPNINRDANGYLISNISTNNQWYKDGSVISGATSQTFKPTEIGRYTVNYTLNSCQSAFSEIYYYAVTGIVILDNGQFIKIYPNPIKDKIYIDYYLNNPQPLVIKIYNLNGNLVKENDNSFSNTSVDLSSLVSGSYILQVSNKTGKVLLSEKLIKQ
jgi:hypothetical protein